MQPREVTIAADDYSNSIMMYGDPSMYTMAQAIVDQLGQGAGNVVTQVIELGNLTSDDAVQLITDLQNRRGGSTSTNRPGGGSSSGGIEIPRHAAEPESRQPEPWEPQPRQPEPRE